MLNIFINNFNNMSGLKPVEETNDPLFKLLNNLGNTPQFDLNQANRQRTQRNHNEKT